MKGKTDPEFKQDCFARAMLKWTKAQKMDWSVKQSPATLDDMRERMVRIRNEKRGR